jgi:hypothetical protein
VMAGHHIRWINQVKSKSVSTHAQSLKARFGLPDVASSNLDGQPIYPDSKCMERMPTLKVTQETFLIFQLHLAATLTNAYVRRMAVAMLQPLQLMMTPFLPPPLVRPNCTNWRAHRIPVHDCKPTDFFLESIQRD